MKTTSLLLVGSLILISVVANAQAATQVNGRPVRRQLESMVFMKWDKKYFRPKWYYFLFHNKYRKGKDKRTILQLAPTAAFVRANKEKAEEQDEDTQEVGRQEGWSFVNHTANAHYRLIFRKKLDKLSDEITGLIGEGQSAGMENEVVVRLRQELERLEDEVEIIKEGYLNEGIKSEEFIRIEQEMKALKGFISELLYYYRLRSKYE